jgi:hypothetical protein
MSSLGDRADMAAGSKVDGRAGVRGEWAIGFCRRLGIWEGRSGGSGFQTWLLVLVRFYFVRLSFWSP